MRIDWYGQAAFRLSDGETTVFVDPFGIPDDERLSARGMRFEYPPIRGVEADLVLVTHEHFDHNGVEAIGGAPAVIRSTAGKLESPVGEVVAIASEHDDQAGTARGPNTIFCFTLGGLRVCHMGDLGQADLRPEQERAIGDVDVLLIPVGAGPTIGPERASDIVRRLAPRLTVPMHYRTPAINFLEPADAFLELQERVVRVEGSAFDTEQVEGTAVVVPAPPVG